MSHQAPPADASKARAPRTAVPVTPQTRASSLTDLLGAVVRLLPLQMKDELALAKGHVAAKGKKAGIGAGVAVVGLFFLALMVVALVVTLIGAFADPTFWFPALMVALAFLVLGLIFAGVGLVMVKGAMPLVPQETVRNLEYDLGYLKEGNAFDPAEYDRLKAERAEAKRVEAAREAERKKVEKEENKKARKNGEAAPPPGRDDATEAEIEAAVVALPPPTGDPAPLLDAEGRVEGALTVSRLAELVGAFRA